jgi:hypothetical protein
MPIPLSVDPRALAAELELTVAEFNRLAALAGSMGVEVIAEVRHHVEDVGINRPELIISVEAP